jgi:hypothetical protein
MCFSFLTLRQASIQCGVLWSLAVVTVAVAVPVAAVVVVLNRPLNFVFRALLCSLREVVWRNSSSAASSNRLRVNNKATPICILVAKWHLTQQVAAAVTQQQEQQQYQYQQVGTLLLPLLVPECEGASYYYSIGCTTALTIAV